MTGLVNKNVPRTFGDGIIHSSHVDVMVEGDELLPEFTGMKLTPEIHEIARLIADDLVQDGATIQTGKNVILNWLKVLKTRKKSQNLYWHSLFPKICQN